MPGKDGLIFAENVPFSSLDQPLAGGFGDGGGEVRAVKFVEQCLSALSAPQRELVLAPYLQHGRITELAEQSNTTVNALYKKLGRLRNQLRSCVRQRLAAV